MRDTQRIRKMGVLGAFFMCALAAVGLVFIPEAYAEDLPEYRLQISPTGDLIELNPGDTKEGVMRVQNTGTKDFNYKVSVSPYSVNGENYDADFETNTNYTRLANWVELSQTSGTLEPNQTEEIKYTIKVPSDAPGGGQYATILAWIDGTEQQETNGSAIKSVARTAYLLYAHIDGEIDKSAKIVENKIPSFLFNPPIEASSIIENDGNIDGEASYTLQVFPLFSDEEVYTNEEDQAKQRILPGTRRFYSTAWEGAPQLGIFKVKQTVRIFDEVSVTEKTVFLCPIWFLFIVLLIIFMAIFWIVMRIRNRKKEQ